jgi:hypothetical protein
MGADKLKEQLKNTILTVLSPCCDFTFPELINCLEKEGFIVKGNHCLYNNNSFFWYDISLEFINAIIELQKADKIKLQEVDKMVYAINSDEFIKKNIKLNGTELGWCPTIIRLKQNG